MSDNQVVINLDSLVNLGKQIAELDTQLDSLSDGATAGKRAFVNALVKDQQAMIDAVLLKLDEQVFNPVQIGEDKQPVLDSEGNPVIVELSDEAFIGILNGVLRGLSDRYNPHQEEILTARAEEIKNAVPAITPEQVKEVTETRKTLATQFKAMKEIFKTFGMPGVDSVPDPKKRTGARGKRGPRAISQYTWEVDGIRQPADKDTLAGVAADNGYETSKALRDAMREAKIDLKDPDPRIEFTMANSKSLVGTKLGGAEEEEDDSDLDEDEDETENASV